MRFSRDKTESEGEITRQLSLPDSATVGNQVASTSLSLLKASRLVFPSITNFHYLDAYESTFDILFTFIKSI